MKEKIFKNFICLSSRWRCSIKKGVLKISQSSWESACVRVSFSIKLKLSASNSIKKETLTQVFSGELCKIFKNTLSTKHPRATDSVYIYHCSNLWGWNSKKILLFLLMDLLHLISLWLLEYENYRKSGSAEF